jgi:hypothetical protein
MIYRKRVAKAALFFCPYICFMVNIQQVYNTVKDVINKENNGFINLATFNSFAVLAQMNIYNRIFNGSKDAKRLMRAGLNPSRDKSLEKRFLEDMSYYATSATISKEASSGQFLKPNNISKIISITTDGSVLMDMSTRQNIEVCYDEEKIERMLRSNISRPTDNTPVALVSNKIEVYPTSINRIKVRFYSTPSSRNSSNVRTVGVPLYSASSSIEAFDSSTSRHFDLPDHYLEEVVYEICNMAGVNLRDDSAATYGAQSSERAKSEKIS